MFWAQIIASAVAATVQLAVQEWYGHTFLKCIPLFISPIFKDV